MKKQKQTQTSLAKKRVRLAIGAAALLVICLLTVGVVAGISKKAGPVNSTKPNVSASASTGNATRAPMQSATQSAQIKPLTPEEAQKLAAALKELANQSTEGLTQVKHADGTVQMDTQGHFQNVALAKRNEDGSVSQTCIDNPQSGAAFFGLDPKLVGLKSSSNATPRNTSTNQ